MRGEERTVKAATPRMAVAMVRKLTMFAVVVGWWLVVVELSGMDWRLLC